MDNRHNDFPTQENKKDDIMEGSELDQYFSEFFAAYDPELQPDNLFLSRLERNLHNVELVKKRLEDRQRLNRIALYAATITGFIAGIIATLCYSRISGFFSWIAGSLYTTAFTARTVPTNLADIILLPLLALTVLAITYASYDIAFLVFKRGVSEQIPTHP